MKIQVFVNGLPGGFHTILVLDAAGLLVDRRDIQEIPTVLSTAHALMGERKVSHVEVTDPGMLVLKQQEKVTLTRSQLRLFINRPGPQPVFYREEQV